jgi:hypothetical protein
MKPQWRQVGCTPAPYVNRPRETGADFFEVHMAAIMPMDEPRPHGSVIGERVGGAPLGEGENFFKCDKCGGWFDARDLARVEDHQAALPHSAMDQVQ